MTNRRKFLAGIGTAAVGSVAGCAGQNTIYDQSETTTLNEDEYSWYNFSIEEPSTVEYTMEVTEGPNVDIILMDRGSFEAYQDGDYDSATYYTRMSDINTAYAELSGEMRVGSYTLMLDNTSDIGTSPPTNLEDDVAVIDFDFTVYR
jgi:hypothetical protein